ncbi:EF-hand domain-containing protein [Methylomonas sp. AM2-LC]|uniref:EF-hand domain-containing protein n=1 Tax=Methylomonas sp. AM2-LC TaxID=3153301 RepID=UPI003267983C
MMSDLDPNNTGKVSKDQFVSALTAKGVSSTDATKMFSSIDTKGTGSITKSDIETAIKNGNLKPPSGGSGAPGGSGGPGGSGAPGGAGGAGGAAGTSSSSTNKTYDAADTNQDGVVSPQEKSIYASKHPNVSTTESSNTNQSNLGNNVDKHV